MAMRTLHTRFVVCFAIRIRPGVQLQDILAFVFYFGVHLFCEVQSVLNLTSPLHTQSWCRRNT